MRIVLSVMLLLPLVRGLPGISLSCFVLGNQGCQFKCLVKCLLLGCVSHNSSCDGWSHCECNETYDLGYTQLTNSDFETLELEELWNKIFEASESSTKLLRRIKGEENAEQLVLKLLRDPYVTGEDIISILSVEYPKWKWVKTVKSHQHGLKTQFADAGKPIPYSALNANLGDWLQLLNTIPDDETDIVSYKIRVKNMLRKITDVSDLEQILHLIMLSGHESLLRLVKSSLRNFGYGFEEDGDSPEGKIAILKTILTGIDEANEDEKLDVAVTNKLLAKKKSRSGRAGAKKKGRAEPPVEDAFVSENSPPSAYEDATAVSQVSHFAGPVASYYVPPAVYSGAAAYGTGYGNTVSYQGAGVERSSSGGQTLYYVVVDENGNVVQASGLPKKPITFPSSNTQWID